MFCSGETLFRQGTRSGKCTWTRRLFLASSHGWPGGPGRGSRSWQPRSWHPGRAGAGLEWPRTRRAVFVVCDSPQRNVSSCRTVRVDTQPGSQQQREIGRGQLITRSLKGSSHSGCPLQPRPKGWLCVDLCHRKPCTQYYVASRRLHDMVWFCMGRVEHDRPVPDPRWQTIVHYRAADVRRYLLDSGVLAPSILSQAKAACLY